MNFYFFVSLFGILSVYLNNIFLPLCITFCLSLWITFCLSLWITFFLSFLLEFCLSLLLECCLSLCLEFCLSLLMKFCLDYLSNVKKYLYSGQLTKCTVLLFDSGQYAEQLYLLGKPQKSSFLKGRATKKKTLFEAYF